MQGVCVLLRRAVCIHIFCATSRPVRAPARRAARGLPALGASAGLDRRLRPGGPVAGHALCRARTLAVIRTSASRHDHLSSRYPDAITCGMARCGDGASRPHTCGTVSRLVHRGGASGGAAATATGAAQDSRSPPAGSAGHGGVEANTTCRTWQRPARLCRTWQSPARLVPQDSVVRGKVPQDSSRKTGCTTCQRITTGPPLL